MSPTLGSAMSRTQEVHSLGMSGRPGIPSVGGRVCGPGESASILTFSLATTRFATSEVHAGQTKARPAGVYEFGTYTKSLLHENRETSEVLRRVGGVGSGGKA